MSTTNLIILIAVALGGLALTLLVFYYNSFVRLRNQAHESMSDIEVQLKRRYDLIPNLVETVKGYASHEQATFENVVKARSQAMSAQGPAQRAGAENFLSQTLKSLFALGEAYPELKANQNFSQLHKSLSEIEENIQLARRYYNAVVRDYNNLCQSFPPVIVAGMFGYRTMEFLDFDDEVHDNVKVQF